MDSLRSKISRERSSAGQSLIEILIAIGIGAILFVGAASLISPGLQTNRQVKLVQTGAAFGWELFDNVRVWSGNWNNVLSLATGTASVYYLNTSSSPFTAISGTQSLAIGTTTYNRYFYLSDVYRDVNGNVTSTVSGNSYDPSTKKITVGYSWLGTATTTITAYLTRNQTFIYEQNDWSGGPNWNGPATTTNNQFSTSTNMTYSTPGVVYATASGTPGILTSATFDTGVTSGAQFNSILWQGSSVNNSTVEFQLAASNASSGPWNFMGPDGTVNTYYVPTGPGVAASLGYSAFNNFRYFRYRLLVVPVSTGSSNVNSVIVNWSP